MSDPPCGCHHVAATRWVPKEPRDLPQSASSSGHQPAESTVAQTMDWNQGSNSSSLANMESGQPTETGSASGHPPESADCGRPADSPDSGGRADIGREEPPQQQLLLTSPPHFRSMLPRDQDSKLHPKEEMAEEVGTAPMSPTWPSHLVYPPASRSTSGNPCNPHDAPPSIVAPSLNHREEMAVKVAPKQKLPANSPDSGGQAGTGGAEPLQQQLSPTSAGDLDSRAAQDENSQLQPKEKMTVEEDPDTMSLVWPSDWGPRPPLDNVMVCQLPPEEDQALSIV